MFFVKIQQMVDHLVRRIGNAQQIQVMRRDITVLAQHDPLQTPPQVAQGDQALHRLDHSRGQQDQA